MAGWRAAGRVSRAGRLEGAGLGSGSGRQFVDFAGRVDAEPGQQVPGGLGQFGALLEGPGWPGESAEVDAVEFAAHLRPGLARRVGDREKPWDGPGSDVESLSQAGLSRAIPGRSARG